MRKVFINADDFGVNASVNKAIVELLNKGVINSTTLMANMPGFSEAVKLAHQHKLIDKIGVHLVLTEGPPLTPEIKSVSFLFNGKDKYRKFRYRLFLFRKRYRKLIYNEFAAQIEMLQKNNIPITHIDTHHHIHEVFTITKIILELKEKYNIPSIRILNNLEKPTKFYKRIYRHLVNYYIKNKKANYSELFGNRSDFIEILNNNPSIIGEKSIEVMVHPDYNYEGEIIDKVGLNKFDFSYLESQKVNASV
ncbi:ChbG/HpnK family deacetylase [Ginsengibacter hankyongi]|uniref:ChbG/HpnK family deacetylase n=1 Tax=Ginsengibacter hankyongi TaxID=2607284 RepID=A0A5J5IIX8_9BACT|nr:ChbG/HpnK family deacetylase [Ginsengibacter hankyongi]KAA9039292.1 ChbG/HpnK family deacetylase [Ginsengibacter hankyongi]